MPLPGLAPLNTPRLNQPGYMSSCLLSTHFCIEISCCCAIHLLYWELHIFSPSVIEQPHQNCSLASLMETSLARQAAQLSGAGVNVQFPTWSAVHHSTIFLLFLRTAGWAGRGEITQNFPRFEIQKGWPVTTTTLAQLIWKPNWFLECTRPAWASTTLTKCEQS